MDFTEIDLLFESASKVLHMDASHDALRSKLQEHISAEHRKANASSDSASYYNTPYVRDVYGDENAGTVVHSKDGKLTASKFKKQGDGKYALSGHKSVKQAYVADNDADDKKESLVVMIDGDERILQEQATEFVEQSDILELQEAAKTGTAKITLITAGKGSSGYYTESALKKAAADKVFNTGTQMFLNHQTREERAARPEGDITKLAGTLTGPAEYVEGVNGAPGRLVAPAKVFGTYKDFLTEAKDDIGVSVRVGATPSGKVRDGVPLVENMVYALSADFVTKAGRGGKIDELYESYRAVHPPVAGGNQPQEDNMTNEEKELFAKLEAKVDRLQESNVALRAESLVNQKLANSGLKPRGQDRVRKSVLANVPMKNGVLDETALEESVKTIVADELAYLQESGVQPTMKIVRSMGVVPQTDADGKELSESDVAAQADKVFEESIGSIFGKEKKSA
jgi:hypothetical protein